MPVSGEHILFNPTSSLALRRPFARGIRTNPTTNRAYIVGQISTFLYAMPPRVPTVNDLRVKLCYICREEEHADTPQEGLPRAWTHPCNCTLIAHEQCLLKWIQTSQGTASRAPNALKCPQCNTEYEMDSDEPFVLKGLAIGNRVLQRMGRYFTVFAAAAAVGVVSTSVYICLTAYGAWAVKKFIGDELFDLILTDDPVNWPWSAYINLPLLPISLILSRFQSPSSSMVVPLLLVWPPSTPVGEQSRRLFEYWIKPENASRLTRMSLLPAKLWPPPPVIFGILGVPLVKGLYKRCYSYLYWRVLGTKLPQPRRLPRDGLRFNEGPFVIRIRANLDIGGEAQQQDGQDGQNQDGEPAPAPVPADGGVLGDPNADPNALAVQAAEQLIEVDAASLGRRVGGALVIPAISNMMGSLLFRFSKHSKLLSRFLGIRPATRVSGSLPLPPWGRLAALTSSGETRWKELSPLMQAKVGFKLVLSAFLGGSKTWLDSDPVWWRNGVGFGLFIVAKDCVQLLHLWLAKRELESRRVKDRDFKGVDIRELDLLPSFLQREGL